MTDRDHPHRDRQNQRLQWTRRVLHNDRLELKLASQDAGFRTYWRTVGEQPTHIVMDAPPDKEPIAPWLTYQALLARGLVRVPAVMATEPTLGLMLLEDLGPTTLSHRLTDDNADHWFALALEQLVRLQQIPPPSQTPIFDRAHLQQEAQLFVLWFLQEHLQLSLNPSQRHRLQAIDEQLAHVALSQQQVLIHRDFMSRNLIVVHDTLAVIDFQDCQIGPVGYDPICLFKDTGVTWPLPRVERWLCAYHHQAQQAGIPVGERKQFLRDADWLGIQRHLKVIGIFARLFHRDSKPQYLSEIPRLLSYLLAVLPRYPELQDLADLLHTTICPAYQRRLHSQG